MTQRDNFIGKYLGRYIVPAVNMSVRCEGQRKPECRRVTNLLRVIESLILCLRARCPDSQVAKTPSTELTAL